MIVDGAIAVKDSTIAWSLPSNVYYYLLNVLESLDEFADKGQYVRTRVRLRGGLIWGAGTDATSYLDGQCFGVSSVRADGTTPRTDLILPSGAAAKASDFESWFDLAPLPRVASLSVAPPAVAWVLGPKDVLRLVDASDHTVAASPVLNLSLNYNAINATQVAITVSGGTAGIVNVKSPVTVPRGATSPQQAIPVSVGNPGAKTEAYTFTANVILASGDVYTIETTLTVTGHAPSRRRSVFQAPLSPTAPGVRGKRKK
jgi:hypothetical protein